VILLIMSVVWVTSLYFLIFPSSLSQFNPRLDVSPDLNDKFSVFERWLRENGTKTRKLELRDYGNEVRGCHATSEITEDETIIEVPLKCLITVEMGKDTEVRLNYIYCPTHRYQQIEQ
jgi:hypothetical protein